MVEIVAGLREGERVSLAVPETTAAGAPASGHALQPR
jgi:hypothetical protein